MKFRQYYVKTEYGYYELQADNKLQAEDIVDEMEERSDLDRTLWIKTEGWIRGDLDEDN